MTSLRSRRVCAPVPCQARVERAEDDVCDVERAELAGLEDGAELIAIPPAPMRGVEGDEEPDQRLWLPSLRSPS